MIVTTPELTTFQTLVLLHNRSEEYVLTGSRFFGTAHNNSDWDFMTTYTEQLGRSLHSMGFRTHLHLEASGGYSDQLTVLVLRKHRIDVQLVRNVALKDKAQRFLRGWGINHPLISQWNLAIDLCREIPETMVIRALTS